MVTVIASLVITGFLGSIGHCTGMCGPLVIMMSRLIPEGGPPRIVSHFIYHGARITVYIILGGLAGYAGTLISLAKPFNTITGTLSIILGIVIVILGLIYLGLFSPRWSSGQNSWLTKTMGKAFKLGGTKGLILLGALNGLLPCGLVYSALLVAASTANPFYGMLAMLTFGLATIPVLIALGAGSAIIKLTTKTVFLRLAGILILLVGIQQIMRGFSTLHVISPLVLGGIVLW